MREHIIAAAFGFDEPEAFGVVEPFDRPKGHNLTSIFSCSRILVGPPSTVKAVSDNSTRRMRRCE